MKDDCSNKPFRAISQPAIVMKKLPWEFCDESKQCIWMDSRGCNIPEKGCLHA